MRIGAYPFAVSGDMERNLRRIRRGIQMAAEKGVRLLAFPECALTGYPPRDLPHPAQADQHRLAHCHEILAELAVKHDMCIVAGTIVEAEGGFHNSAAVFAPDGQGLFYHKRALWGWDRDHFRPGDAPGVFEIDGLRIGVRICYEVRFPEYFRELYRAGTDLNVILFYDVADADDGERYALIRSHIRTRAVENVCPVLAVNATRPFQTAPTGLYDRSGGVLAEIERGGEGLLVYDLAVEEPDFGERGRRTISDSLVKH